MSVIAAATECSECRVDLAGTLDTFGPADAPVCAKCWCANRHVLKPLEDELETAEELLEYAEDEVYQAKHFVRECEQKVAALKARIVAAGGAR
jgi:hypothetical protein